MAGSVSPLPHQEVQVQFVETIQELRSQLEESKQRFRDLKEEFLICKCTAYSLAIQLQKYKCEKDKAIIDSVLNEKWLSKEGELSEKLMLAEKLRESKVLIEDQAQELSQLRKKITQGREMSLLLSEHLWELITQKDSDSRQEQDLFELMEEGHRLTECLVLKLSSENHEVKENGEEQKPLAPSLSKEEHEEEEGNEGLQDSVDEGHKTSSRDGDLSDIHQTPCSSADLMDEQEVSCPLNSVQTQDNQNKEEEEAAVDPSMQLQEEKKEEMMDSLDEMYLNSSYYHVSSEFHQPPKTPASLSEEHVVYSGLDVAKYHDKGDNDEQQSLDFRFNNGLQEERANRALSDEHYFPPSGHPDFSNTQEHLRSSLLSEEELRVSSAVHGANLSLDTSNGMEMPANIVLNDLDRSAANTHKFQEQVLNIATMVSTQKAVNRKVLQRSCRLACRFPGIHISEIQNNQNEEEEGASVDPRSHDFSESYQPLKSPASPSEEHVVYSTLDVASEYTPYKENNAPGVFPENHEVEENGEEQKPLAPSLSKDEHEEEEGNEGLQDSVDEGHKTSSRNGDLSDIHQTPCSSADLMDEQEVSCPLNSVQMSLNTSDGMEMPANIVVDDVDISAANTRGLQEHVLNVAPMIVTQKVVNRKLLLDNCRVACRLPGFQVSVRDIHVNSTVLVHSSSSSSSPGSEAAIDTRKNELDLDSPPALKNPVKLKGDTADGSFDNNPSCHVLGYINDYSALMQQIGKSKQLVQKILSLMRLTCNLPGLETQDTQTPENKIFHELQSSASALHHSLKESTSLLNMFQLVVLPRSHGVVLPDKEGQAIERDILKLQARVAKQERLLRFTTKCLKTVQQQKENREQFILSQLTITNNVLKKARTNLQLKKQLYLSKPQSLLPAHHDLSSDQ